MAIIDKLSAIGSAIRAKTGRNGLLTLAQMPDEIASIETGSSDVPFIFGGLNAEKVAEYSETFTLADTSFVIGSSESTSATSIKATVSNRFTSASIAIGDRDIIVLQKILVTPVHGSGATGKAQANKYAYVYLTQIAKGRRSPTVATNYTRRTVNFGFYQIDYMNASGVQTIANANYGFYATPSASTVSSTSASSATVRASSPILYYRASSTYESTTNIKLVTACTWDWDVEVYLVDAQTTPNAGIQALANELIYGA